MKQILPLLLALALATGCVHTAKPIKPPDPSAMNEHGRKLAAAVASARIHVQEAGKALAGSEKSITAARALFDIVLPKIDALPLDTPAEMKLAVASIQEDMSSLRGLLDDTSAGTVAARVEMTAVGAKLEEATAEKNATMAATDQYVKQADAIVKDRNDLDAKFAKDSKALAWYRLHWWGAWLVAGAGLLICVIGFLAKITAKAAL